MKIRTLGANWSEKSLKRKILGALTVWCCSKSVKIRLVPTWYLQTWCKLLKQLASSLWIKKFWQSTCSKPVDILQQTCYHQAWASDANAFWYRLDDNKATSLQQTCWNFHVSGCVILKHRRIAEIDYFLLKSPIDSRSFNNATPLAKPTSVAKASVVYQTCTYLHIWTISLNTFGISDITRSTFCC